MPNVQSPFGLRPVNADAATATRAVRAYGGSPGDNVIPSGYGTAIFKNTPVQLSAAGQIVPVTGVTGASAAILGSFVGAEYTDINNRRRETPFWPPGVLTFAGGTVSTRAFVYSAENGIFEVQLNGTMAQSLTGSGINMLLSDLSPPAGSLITGLSSARADHTPVAAGVESQLQVLGVGLSVNNTISDLYPNVRVKVNLPQTQAQWPAPL